jgi:hypothetical protein
MSRVASKGSETVGEIIEDTLHEFLKMYGPNEKRNKADQEAHRLVRHALTLFAHAIGETFTGFGPDDVMVQHLSLPGHGE